LSAVNITVDFHPSKFCYTRKPNSLEILAKNTTGN